MLSVLFLMKREHLSLVCSLSSSKLALKKLIVQKAVKTLDFCFIFLISVQVVSVTIADVQNAS